MTIKDFFVDMFSADKAVSAKRVSGVLGWLICLVICMYCTFTNIEAPGITDTLFICSTALIGLDSITGIFNKTKNVTVKSNLSK